MTSKLEFLGKFKYHNETHLRRESSRPYRRNKIFTRWIVSDCIVRQTIILLYEYIRHDDLFNKSHILALYGRNIENLEVKLRSLLLSMLLTRELHKIKSLDHIDNCVVGFFF